MTIDVEKDARATPVKSQKAELSLQERNDRFRSATIEEVDRVIGLIEAMIAEKCEFHLSDTTLRTIAWGKQYLPKDGGAIVRNSEISISTDRNVDSRDLKNTNLGVFFKLMCRLSPRPKLKIRCIDSGIYTLETTDIPTKYEPAFADRRTRGIVRDSIGNIDSEPAREALLVLVNEYAPTAVVLSEEITRAINDILGEKATITTRNGLSLLHPKNEAATLFTNVNSSTDRFALRPPSKDVLRRLDYIKMVEVVEAQDVDYNELAKQILQILTAPNVALNKRSQGFFGNINKITVYKGNCATISKSAAKKLLEAFIELQNIDVDNNSDDKNEYTICLTDLIERLSLAVNETKDGDDLSHQMRAKIMEPNAIIRAHSPISEHFKNKLAIPHLRQWL